MTPSEERIQAVAEAFVDASETIIAIQYGPYSFDDLPSEAKTRFRAGAKAAIAVADATRPELEVSEEMLNAGVRAYVSIGRYTSQRETVKRAIEAALKVTE